MNKENQYPFLTGLEKNTDLIKMKRLLLKFIIWVLNFLPKKKRKSIWDL